MIVPASIEDFPVVECRISNISIESLTILDNVVHININGCSSLEKVNLPKTLKTIEPWGFCDTGIKEIALPEGVKTIPERAFYKTPIKSIIIPESVELIDKNAFEECAHLETVAIGNGVKVIEYHAFSGCSALKTVTIGKGIKNIGAYAFAYCSSLNTFNIGVEKFNGESFRLGENLYIAGCESNAFYRCSSLGLKEQAKIRKTGYSDEF